MSDYSLTKSRTLQWMIIILVLVALVGAYRYFSVRAATKINSSQNATNTNGLVGQWSFNGADMTNTTTYATWNPSDKAASFTLSGGDKIAAPDSSGTPGKVRATIGKSSGKWYWEYVIVSYASDVYVGVATSAASVDTYTGAEATSWSMRGDTFGVDKNTNGTPTAYGGTGTLSPGDVIGVALDMNAGTIVFYINNTSQGTAFTGLTGTLYPSVGDSGTFSAPTITANFGATAFTYTPPAGYNAGLYTSTLSGATDTSGSGNNGTLVNGPTTTIGKVGQALSFDGTSYVALPSASLLSLSSATSEKTISAWIKTTANDAAIVCGRDGAGSSVFDFSLGENGIASVAGTPTLLVRDDSESGLTYIRGATAINDGKWHHVVAMRNSSKNLYIYVDGVQVASGTDTMATGLTVTAANSRIGDEALNSSITNMNGSIDEVRIYNRALSAGEIASLYNFGAGAKVNASQNSSNTNGLVGQWSFNGADMTANTQVFATLNPAVKAASVTLSNGNLTAAISSTGLVFSTIGNNNNRYWEAKINTLGSAAIGVAMGSVATSASPGSVANSVGLRANGDIWVNGSLFYNIGSVLHVNDVIGIVMTGNGVSMRFQVNGVDQGGFGGNITLGTYFAAVGSSGGATNLTANFGATPFVYPYYSYSSTYEAGLYTGTPSGATDTSGSSNNGTLTSTTPILGKVGQALSFDGSASSVSVPDATSLKPTSAISYGGWVYVPSTPGGLKTIIEKGTATTAGYGLYVTSDPKVCFVIKTAGGTETNAGPALTTGSWHHIMVTYDSSTPLLYIDGASQSLASGTGCTASTNTGSITQDTSTLTFGSRQGTSQFFAGKEDEIRIYNRALSAGEVTSLYNMGVGTKLTP